MNTEDLFKYGVTPNDGEFAGERFKVISVSESGVSVRKRGDPAGSLRMTFSEGSYKIWHEPKTLFEDDSIVATWGNLKKAVEAAGISDDTEFAVQDDASWLYRGICRPATFSVETLREIYNKPKKYIVVR